MEGGIKGALRWPASGHPICRQCARAHVYVCVRSRERACACACACVCGGVSWVDYLTDGLRNRVFVVNAVVVALRLGGVG
jgi:hypothetical protein